MLRENNSPRYNLRFKTLSAVNALLLWQYVYSQRENKLAEKSGDEQAIPLHSAPGVRIPQTVLTHGHYKDYLRRTRDKSTHWREILLFTLV